MWLGFLFGAVSERFKGPLRGKKVNLPPFHPDKGGNAGGGSVSREKLSAFFGVGVGGTVEREVAAAPRLGGQEGKVALGR